MASIPFHFLKAGAERIPDSAFEKIPFAGPRYFREKEAHDERKTKRKEKQRRRRDRDSDYDQSDGYSDSEYDRSPRSSRPHRSHRRSERRDHDDDRKDRGYESDQGPQSPGLGGHTKAPYFPPPPRIAVDEPQHGQQGVGQEGPGVVPRPYNPAEYGERPGSRDSYFEGHPQEQQTFVPPPPPGGHPQGHTNPSSSRAYNEADYHSSAADRYRPSNYDRGNRAGSSGFSEQYDRDVSPGTQQNRGSPNPTYPSALTVHPQAGHDPYSEYLNPGYDTYQSPDDDDDEEPRHRRRRHSRSRSRDPSRDRSRSSARHSRSRSRNTEKSEKKKGGFEKHKKELGVSALGALAGGIIGNEFGGKKGAVSMLIGAAIGGIGGAAYERKHEEKKMQKNSGKRNSKHANRDGYTSE